MSNPSRSARGGGGAGGGGASGGWLPRQPCPSKLGAMMAALAAPSPDGRAGKTRARRGGGAGHWRSSPANPERVRGRAGSRSPLIGLLRRWGGGRRARVDRKKANAGPARGRTIYARARSPGRNFRVSRNRACKAANAGQADAGSFGRPAEGPAAFCAGLSSFVFIVPAPLAAPGGLQEASGAAPAAWRRPGHGGPATQLAGRRGAAGRACRRPGSALRGGERRSSCCWAGRRGAPPLPPAGPAAPTPHMPAFLGCRNAWNSCCWR